MTIEIHPFIGREQEMAELIEALDSAEGGHGGLVMLVGEPGIGKTRLGEELETVALERGVHLAKAACYEGGSAPPYWPWTQAIRSLLTEPGTTTLTALDARARVITEIVPELRVMIPDLEAAPEVDTSLTRFTLFDSLSSVLKEKASPFRDVGASGTNTRIPSNAPART